MDRGMVRSSLGREGLMGIRWRFLMLALCSSISLAHALQDSTLLNRSPEADAKEHLSRAVSATQAHDFATAEKEWRAILATDPNSAQALNNLGMVLYLNHKYADAESTLRKALASPPPLASSKVLLGATLQREGKNHEAITLLQPELKSPLNGAAERTARMALHEAFFASGDYANALEALQPLAKKYPRDADVLYSLGRTYLQLATQSFEHIAAVDPQSYRVHQVLAEALGQEGRYHEAIAEYRLALSQRPDLPGAHYQIGLLYRTYENSPQGDEEALREFESELKINPFDAWSEYRIGRIFVKQGRTDDAVVHLFRAVELDETIIPARLVLARVLEQRGDTDKAREQLEAAAQIEPGNATVHYRLANLLKTLGDRSGAEREMKKFELVRAEHEVRQQELEKAIRRSVEPESDDPEASPPAPE